MTPDSVILRFIQLLETEPVDRHRLMMLLGADADLLARWLNLFGIPADPTEVAVVFQGLDDAGLCSLGEAQAVAVVRPSGSPPVSLTQWQTVLRAGCFAEALGEWCGVPHPIALRWRVMLALSEIHLDSDPVLQQMHEYRGAAVDLFEDADLSNRVFSVVEADARHSDLAAAERAQKLLEMDLEVFTRLRGRAEQFSTEIVSVLELSENCEGDPSRMLWFRQQMQALAPFFVGQSRLGRLDEANRLGSHSLFGRSAQLWVAEGDRLRLRGHGLEISSQSTTSLIARAFRNDDRGVIDDSAHVAVVDRQALQLLGGNRAFCLATGTPTKGVIVFPLGRADEPQSSHYSYARLFGRYLGAGDDSQRQLNAYRTEEQRRLREIVHEVNNPLSVVANYLHILRLRAENDERMQEHVDIIGSELHRASELLRGVIDVPTHVTAVESGTLQGSAVDVNATVSRIALLQVGSADAAGVNIEMHLDPAEIIIQSDRDRLMQVLTNLTKNAIEALPDGGQLILATNAGLVRAGRPMVEVRISDNGPGLPNEVLGNLFAPKESDKGGDHAGLGLYIANRLMVELDGEVDVRSSELGTEFLLYLPA